MSPREQKVAVITGDSQGIGAGLIEAYRQRARQWLRERRRRGRVILLHPRLGHR